MPYKLSVLQPNPKSVLDFSTLATTERCPRKGFYQYILDRAPVGTNYPINFGVAYHTFREHLEGIYRSEHLDPTDKPQIDRAFERAWDIATEGWIDPPIGHYKEWMTKGRLRKTCIEALRHWLVEKLTGEIIVLEIECAFDLPLPSGERYGGRFDQIIERPKPGSSERQLWVRDFKTVSRKPSAAQYDPHNQFTGYVWAAEQLSGREVAGVLVETMYNTKTMGPEIKPYLSTRTPFHISDWIEDVESSTADYRRMVETGIFPKRTSACADYGGCYFRRCCGSDGWAGIERWLLDETIESTWDFANPDDEEGIATR